MTNFASVKEYQTFLDDLASDEEQYCKCPCACGCRGPREGLSSTGWCQDCILGNHEIPPFACPGCLRRTNPEIQWFRETLQEFEVVDGVRFSFNAVTGFYSCHNCWTKFRPFAWVRLWRVGDILDTFWLVGKKESEG